MAQPHPSGSGGAPSDRGRSTRGGPPSAVNVGLVALAGLVLLGVLTGGGRLALTQLSGFLIFYMGVFTLVSLTLTVIAGLIATDRIILVARHRMWVQSVHRTLGIVAVACLGLHIATELAAARVGVFGALVPFTGAPFAIGLGSVAAYLMITVMWTGIVRARFAQNDRAWMWRPVHAVAYLSWPVAVWHGLTAGRPPAVWVSASYLVLLFLTAVALGLRLSAERNRRQQQLAADRTTTTIAPVGRPVPAASGRASRSTGRGGKKKFRWDAPPADQLWQEQDRPEVEMRAEYADYRTAGPSADAPVTAVPTYADAPATAIPATYAGRSERADRYESDPYATDFYDSPPAYRDEEPPPYRTEEPPAYRAEAPPAYRTEEPPAYRDEPMAYREPVAYRDEQPVAYRDPEPIAYRDEEPSVYRGAAAAPSYEPYDTYDPYDSAYEPAYKPSYQPAYEPAAYEPAYAPSYEPAYEPAYESVDGRHARPDSSADLTDTGLTLRDRFAARRSRVAETADPDRDGYPDDDDTPTLVDLDTRRAMRRRARGEDESSRDTGRDAARRYRYDDEWTRLRGEAR